MKILKKFIDKHPSLIQNIKQTLMDLEDDPFKASLKTHKLIGSLSGKYSPSGNWTSYKPSESTGTYPPSIGIGAFDGFWIKK